MCACNSNRFKPAKVRSRYGFDRDFFTVPRCDVLGLCSVIGPGRTHQSCDDRRRTANTSEQCGVRHTLLSETSGGDSHSVAVKFGTRNMKNKRVAMSILIEL